jgi:uncharacterized protein YndB with AHSA1/START domain
MRIDYHLDINAPVGTVFELIDDEEKVKRWMDGLEETIYPSGRNLDSPLGTRFVQRIREGGRVSEYEGEVIAYEKPIRLAIDVGNRQFTMRVNYRLSVTPWGTTLDYSVETVRSTWLMKILSGLFRAFTLRILDRQMRKLKQLAESQPQSLSAGRA